MSKQEFKRYSYKGPVCEFGRVIAHMWEAETCAQSATKAMSNLAFQFKRDNKRTPNTKITLPGKITAA